MKKIAALCILVALTVTLTACFEDLDDNASSVTNINDFVWKGLNAIYLYKSEVPDLFDDRFSSEEAYLEYLNSFNTPEALFGSLLYLPETVDRFSRIYSNYFDLLNFQDGNTLSTGLEVTLYPLPGSETDLYGVITLVLNNSVADDLGLQRGQIFRTVDGTNLNRNNAVSLLNQNTITLGFADYNTNNTPEDINDDSVNLNGTSVVISPQQYTENPVHLAEVLEVSDTKIGYLMYNGFRNNFENELNAAFGNFSASGIDELVIDLRYNGGGSVQTAAYLGSMITGQFTGQVFSKLFYNANFQSSNRDFLFENSIEGSGGINSLNLSRVYILTTNLRTASASELLINSLDPYIDVVVIGENTVGKTQASVTVFDSPSLLSSTNADPSHTYAMQPLVADSANVNDELVPSNGLTPEINISEVPFNLGTLGDLNEPLLAAAINEILGAGRPLWLTPDLKPVQLDGLMHPMEQELFIDSDDNPN